jgi:hypothetical protein
VKIGGISDFSLLLPYNPYSGRGDASFELLIVTIGRLGCPWESSVSPMSGSKTTEYIIIIIIIIVQKVQHTNQKSELKYSANLQMCMCRQVQLRTSKQYN